MSIAAVDQEIGTMEESVQVERRLAVFSNETDFLIAEYEFVNFDLAAFRAHFDRNNADPLLYYEHEVEPQDIEFLSNYLPKSVEFDFQRYAYFVSCSAQNSKSLSTT